MNNNLQWISLTVSDSDRQMIEELEKARRVVSHTLMIPVDKIGIIKKTSEYGR